MSNNNTFWVVFFVRTQKSKDDMLPIYLRITVDNKRTIISLKKEVHRGDWNFGKGMAKPKNEDLKRLNSSLEQIRGRIVEYYHELKIDKQIITPEAIKNKFLGVEEKQHSLLEIFDFHNEQMKNILKWGYCGAVHISHKPVSTITLQ